MAGRLALLIFLALSACHVALLVRETVVEQQWKDVFLSVPTADGAREHLQYYTSVAHSAGTVGDYETALYTHKKFLEYGLNSSIEEFDVLLSWPITRTLTLLEPMRYEAKLKERDYPEDKTMFHPNVMDTFNGYSPSGNVTAEVVYLNYASKTDLELLKTKGVDLQGKIGICRYGKLFRGVKAMIAQEYGLSALLIYSDPIDDGYIRGKTFPEGPYRPISGVQRGSVQFLSICPGDPRRKICQPDDENYNYTKGIPSIPVQPISFEDALPILNSLEGMRIPEPQWSGAANNTFIGPGPGIANLFLDIKFNVTPIWNVIANITGKDNSQSVFVGNHRDAWVFGAVDPNSGTSAMLEAAKGLGLAYKKGWRPNKNIIFGSWDGEEYGLLGSTAFAEKYDSKNNEIVAYLNLDTAVSGRDLHAGATPSLETLFRKVLKNVKDPHSGKPLSDLFSGKKIATLGSGSDYTAFLDHYGVPSLDFGFSGPYGVYHSVYDDFYWMENFGDPTFEYHRAAAQIFGLMAMELADAPVAPLDFVYYGEKLHAYYRAAEQTVHAVNSTVNFHELNVAIANFTTSAKRFHKELLQPVKNVTALNARAMKVERQFISERGLPRRPYFRHMLQAPGFYEGYGSTSFPGLIQNAEEGNWSAFDEYFDILVGQIYSAALALVV